MNRRSSGLSGSSDASVAEFHAAEGYVKFFVRGRPVLFYPATRQLKDYNASQRTTPPDNQLQLEWTYGYRGKDCRSNLHVLSCGELVYFIAGTVVLLAVDDRMAALKQRHYSRHTDHVKCIAVHPDGETIASGQCAGTGHDAQPQVHVWSSVSLDLLQIIGVGHFERSVCCLAFSQCGDSGAAGAYLACVDEGRDIVLSVWNWQQQLKIAEIKAASDTVVDVKWSPRSDNQLISCGKQHVSFWSLRWQCDFKSGCLARRQGLFGNTGRPKYVTTLAFSTSGDLLTGDTDARVLLWKQGENKVHRSVDCHFSSTVFCLVVDQRSGHIFAGAKEGIVVELDENLDFVGKPIELTDEYGGVRAIALWTETHHNNNSNNNNNNNSIGNHSGAGCMTACEHDGPSLAVGTTTNWLLGRQLHTGCKHPHCSQPSQLTWGHTEETWALACDPSRARFASACWSGRLYVVDCDNHCLVSRRHLHGSVHSLGFSADGARLVVALSSGHWLLVEPDTCATKHSARAGSEPLSCVQFSPHGRHLALGSRNGCIYLYSCHSPEEDSCCLMATCSGHSSFISHMDWSECGSYLRSNSGDYELLFWRSTTGKQIQQPSSMRDVLWHTNTCPLTFNTFGVYPEGADGTDINTCWGCEWRHLLACGDDFGRVNLLRFPAEHARAARHSYSGHSSHVTCVRMTADRRRLLTAGGNDTAVLQWCVT